MKNNRVIKFRIGDKKQNKVIYPTFVHSISSDSTPGELQHTLKISWFGDNEEYDIENFVFQQFTGLLDKNGKEIFEGDIVEFNENNPNLIGEVKYDNEFACFIIQYDIDGFVYLSDFPLSVKVIGNIFDNPELIK